MNNKLAYFVIGAILVIVVGVFALSLSGKNIKPAQNPVPTTTTIFNNPKITSKIAEFAEITITDTGITPPDVTIDKLFLVHFINKTEKTVEIVSTGDLKIIIAPIEAGKTGITLLFAKTGEYDFMVKGDKARKGVINVK